MMTEPSGSQETSRYKPSPRVIIGGVIGLLALIFILQNTGREHIHFLVLDIENPAWVWLLVLFAAGFVVGSIFPWFRRRGKRSSGSSSEST
jgi:uncharacterized integral membrane protein